MPDIKQLLFQLIDAKGLLHVAGLLDHKSTSILERWQKEDKIPEAKMFQVMQMLKNEGVLS